MPPSTTIESPVDSSPLPNMVRTSSLDPEFIRRHLSIVNTPVKLLFENDTMEMTKDWTEEEKLNERRLIKFSFVKLSNSDYLVKFRPIKKSEFTNGAAIISCILWKEKELHIVTSVDIILLLEYLVQESFTIEEKNRVRRNLQSLKPYTISKSNKNYQRFFKLLMSMEDPRPRNIEKDLKVFKWSDLFSALNKVISKYSTNSEHLEVEQVEPGQIDTKGKPEIQVPSNGTHFPSPHSPSKEPFLPHERLKVMKKKFNQAHNGKSLHQKHNVFQEGIQPSAPMPIDLKSNERSARTSPKRTSVHDGSMPAPKIKKEANPDPNAMEIDTDSSTGDSSGTYAMTSSDDQIDELGSSRHNSNSVEEGSFNSNSVNLGSGSGSGSGSGYGSGTGTGSGNISGSGFVSGSGSGDSGGDSGRSAVFSNARTQNVTNITEPSGSRPGYDAKISGAKTYNNINNFAQDQSDRMFGNISSQTGTIQQISDHQPQYYHYPKKSQLHYDSTDTGPPVNLPSLETYFQTNNEKMTKINDSGVKLPPLVNAPQSKEARKLSNPNNLIDFSKKSSNVKEVL